MGITSDITTIPDVCQSTMFESGGIERGKSVVFPTLASSVWFGVLTVYILQNHCLLAWCIACVSTLFTPFKFSLTNQSCYTPNSKIIAKNKQTKNPTTTTGGEIFSHTVQAPPLPHTPTSWYQHTVFKTGSIQNGFKDPRDFFSGPLMLCLVVKDVHFSWFNSSFFTESA